MQFHCDVCNGDAIITSYQQEFKGYIEYSSPHTACFYSNKLELIPNRVYTIFTKCASCGLKDVFKLTADE